MGVHFSKLCVLPLPQTAAGDLGRYHADRHAHARSGRTGHFFLRICVCRCIWPTRYPNRPSRRRAPSCPWLLLRDSTTGRLHAPSRMALCRVGAACAWSPPHYGQARANRDPPHSPHRTDGHPRRSICPGPVRHRAQPAFTTRSPGQRRRPGFARVADG